MTLLVANVTPHGLVFAADRNLSDPDTGLVVEAAPKVLKWTTPPLLVGYAGRATVGGERLNAWLNAFLQAEASEDIGGVARRLAERLERDSAGVPPQSRGTIIHLGGFEMTREGPLPVIWYIRDAEIQADGSIRRLGRFVPRDELKVEGGEPPHFGTASGEQIREQLVRAQTPLPWAGFRQSLDLAIFNRLDRLLWAFAVEIALNGKVRGKSLAPPAAIDDWVPYMKMSVLGYAAFFEAFYPPGEQLVGGGVDVEYIDWPA